MGRVVLEHADGRRVGADESELGDPRANPYNGSHDIVEANPLTGGRLVLATDPGRPADDHVSLLDEGFVVVGIVDAQGHERALSDSEEHAALYRGVNLDKHANASAHGKKMADEHRARRASLGTPTHKDLGLEVHHDRG